jgi:hypothetical protein
VRELYRMDSRCTLHRLQSIHSQVPSEARSTRCQLQLRARSRPLPGSSFVRLGSMVRLCCELRKRRTTCRKRKKQTSIQPPRRSPGVCPTHGTVRHELSCLVAADRAREEGGNKCPRASAPHPCCQSDSRSSERAGTSVRRRLLLDSLAAKSHRQKAPAMTVEAGVSRTSCSKALQALSTRRLEECSLKFWLLLGARRAKTSRGRSINSPVARPLLGCGVVVGCGGRESAARACAGKRRPRPASRSARAGGRAQAALLLVLPACCPCVLSPLVLVRSLPTQATPLAPHPAYHSPPPHPSKMSSPASSSPKVVESADPAHHAHSLDGSTVNDDMLVEKRFGIKVRAP